MVVVSFRRVATMSQLPAGRGLCVRIGGIDIGLFKVGSEVHAMENRCPHAGDPLSEGMLDGAIVTCAGHGWEFDVRTGFRPQDAEEAHVDAVDLNAEPATVRYVVGSGYLSKRHRTSSGRERLS